MKAFSTSAAILMFLILYSTSLNAQINTSSQWTWMKGDNYSSTNAGVYGIQGIASPANNTGARYESMRWIDANGFLWLFGGSNGSNAFNDLWKYNTDTNEWTWMNGANISNQPGVYGDKGIAAQNNQPGSRYGGVTWTDDSGNLWLFGGATRFQLSYLNDLWKYNIATNLWTWVSGASTESQPGQYGTKGSFAITNQPGARYQSSSWIDAAGKFWLFGGAGYSSTSKDFLNDLWKYDPVSNQWSWIGGDNSINQAGIYGTMGSEALANSPGARSGNVAWADALGNLWLFGGQGRGTNGGLNSFNDLWKYNLSTNQWTWMNGASTKNGLGSYGILGIPSADNKPGARAGSFPWKDDLGSLWLYGGYDSSAGRHDDLWRYETLSNTWTWMKGSKTTNQSGIYGNIETSDPSNRPGGRGFGVSWNDAAGNFWLFGGYGNGLLNDLWKLGNTVVLPVTMSKIIAHQQNGNIWVNWDVENESGIKQYDVEKSTDGVRFVKAGVRIAEDNNNGKVSYRWVDINPQTGNNYYRISSNSINGQIKLSQIVKVTIGKGASGYTVYPNPVVNGLMQLQFINQPKGLYHVRVMNVTGQLVATYQVAHEEGSSTEVLPLTRHLSKGNYTVEIMSPGKQRKSIRIIF